MTNSAPQVYITECLQVSGKRVLLLNALEMQSDTQVGFFTSGFLKAFIMFMCIANLQRASEPALFLKII